MHMLQVSPASLLNTGSNSVGTINLAYNQSFRIPEVSIFEFLCVAVVLNREPVLAQKRFNLTFFDGKRPLFADAGYCLIYFSLPVVFIFFSQNASIYIVKNNNTSRSGNIRDKHEGVFNSVLR